MPRLKYAAFLRVIVIFGLFFLWLQIMIMTISIVERDADAEQLIKDQFAEMLEPGWGNSKDAHEVEVNIGSLIVDTYEVDINTGLLIRVVATAKEEQMNGFDTSKQVLARVPPELHKYLTVHPRNITDAHEVEVNTGSLIVEEQMNGFDTSKQVLARVPPELHKYLTVHPRNITANSTELPKNITEIRRAIRRYNDAQTILNEEIYGPVQNDTVIIAIQVHTRLKYLRHLIVSLAQARDIERTLLVFSHDYYDEEINSLVRTIDFTKVMQIFYPYSIQTHPNEFPGMDPNDCPRDAEYEEAIKLKCNNALHPDDHGHYREANYTQAKHHWWWKHNRIFNQLQCTASHAGMVVFLEEDHYVAEDFLHVLNLMRTTADKSCPQCELLSLGTYLKPYKNYNATADKVKISNWHSSIHNMGMVFNQTVWTSIVALQDQFCAYDDYNYDFSFLHLSQNRRGKGTFKVMMCMGPRVFHIGKCGLHHKKSNCNANLFISKVQKLMQTTKHLLYPKRLTATINPWIDEYTMKLEKGNGGWGDLRDQELCTNMTKVGRQMKKYE